MVKSLNHVTDDLNYVNQILRPFKDIKIYNFLIYNGLICLVSTSRDGFFGIFARHKISFRFVQKMSIDKVAFQELQTWVSLTFRQILICQYCVYIETHSDIYDRSHHFSYKTYLHFDSNYGALGISNVSNRKVLHNFERRTAQIWINRQKLSTAEP